MTSWQTTNYKLSRHPFNFYARKLGIIFCFMCSILTLLNHPSKSTVPPSPICCLLVNTIIICLELPTSATMFHQLSQFSLNGHCMPPNSDNLHEGKAIRHGSLEKFKVMDNGVRTKKRDWSTVYAFL